MTDTQSSDPPEFVSTAGISLWQDGFRRLKKDRLAVLCFGVLVVYGAVALMAQAGQFVNGLHKAEVVGEGPKAFANAVLFAGYDDADRELGQVGPFWMNDGRWRGSPGRCFHVMG